MNYKHWWASHILLLAVSVGLLVVFPGLLLRDPLIYALPGVAIGSAQIVNSSIGNAKRRWMYILSSGFGTMVGIMLFFIGMRYPAMLVQATLDSFVFDGLPALGVTLSELSQTLASYLFALLPFAGICLGIGLVAWVMAACQLLALGLDIVRETRWLKRSFLGAIAGAVSAGSIFFILSALAYIFAIRADTVILLVAGVVGMTSFSRATYTEARKILVSEFDFRPPPSPAEPRDEDG